MTIRILALVALLSVSQLAEAQEAKRRWEMMNQIRRDKFDYVLPEAMRENNIDMWITMNREGHNDPLYEDLGGGYTGQTGYYIFTDRGTDRIERAVLGISGYLLVQGDAYDYFGSSAELRDFVAAPRPPAHWGQHIAAYWRGRRALSFGL